MLKDWSCVGYEPPQSETKFLVASQAFVIFQTAIFVLSGFL